MAGGVSGGGREPGEMLDEDRVGGNKSRFMVSLGKPQLAALREFAGRKGLSVAEVLRRAVDEFLERRIGESPPVRHESHRDGLARREESL